MNRKISGVIFSYLLIIADIAVAILFVPYLLGSLGKDEYGLYKLMLSTASYLSVLDFGLGGTITRYVVKYKTEKDKKSEENFVAMGLIIYGVLAFVVLLIAVAVGSLIPLMYQSSVAQEKMFSAQLIFILLCSRTAVSLFNHAYHGLFSAYERFSYSKIANICHILLRVLVLIFGLMFWKTAILVALVDFSLSFLFLIINVFYARYGVKCRIKLHKWDKKLAREALVFTSAILIQSIINQFNTNVDSVVLGIYSTTAVIAMYSLVMQLYNMYSGLSTAVSSVFLPSISTAVFSGSSNDEITRKVVTPSRIQLVVLLLAASGFALFGKHFINLWVGEGYEQVYLLTCILMLASVIDLSQNSMTSVLKAKNKLHGKTLILGISTAVNFLITVILVPQIGVLGAVIGTATSMLLGYGVGLNLYYHHYIGINMKLYYKETYKGILPVAILSVCFGLLINYFIRSGGWLMFIVKGVSYTAVFMVLMFFFGFNEKEKTLVRRIANKFKKKG